MFSKNYYERPQKINYMVVHQTKWKNENRYTSSQEDEDEVTVSPIIISSGGRRF
jgi:hypothetical protein